MKLSEDAIAERLARWPVARLATIAPGGRPHQVPIVFARVGELLWSPVDGKPKAGGELARVRNLRDRPRASLLLDEYAPDWSRLWWIRLDVASAVFEAAAATGHRDFAAVTAALALKYPQYRDTPMLLRRPTLLAFRVERATSWSARPAERASGGDGSAYAARDERRT